MLVVEGYQNVPDAARGSAIALGNFDGVHRGHQGLIALAVDKARELGIPAAVMLFEPHPREFFKPDEAHFRLTSLPQKLIELEKLGINLAIVIPFNKEFASLSAEDFIARVLVQSLGVSHVAIGYDFFYGAARKGTPDLMWRAGEELRFGVSVLAPVAHDGEVVSSSGIRLKLAQGDVKSAAEDLGRNWRVAGEVVGGAKRGTGLGFPTANLPMPRGTSLAHGIYAVRAHARRGRLPRHPPHVRRRHAGAGGVPVRFRRRPLRPRHGSRVRRPHPRGPQVRQPRGAGHPDD